MEKTLTNLVPGDKLGSTQWCLVDQTSIDAFAQATGDNQWIHVDVDRCAEQSPFGCTIAHGLLATALMPNAFYELVSLDPSTQTLLNYGIDSLRFLEPVRVNDSIRFHVSLHSTENKSSGVLYRFECQVEIQGRDKPAMVGRFLMLLI